MNRLNAILCTLALSSAGASAALVNLTAVNDVSIADGFGLNANFNGERYVLVNWGCGGDPTCVEPQTSQGLIEFDLSSIPAGSTINNATLYLFHEINDGNGDVFEVYRNIEAFDEATTTFATRPGVDPIAVGQTSIADNVVGTNRVFDVSGVVQGWFDGSIPSFGFTLRQTNEVPVEWIYFSSRETIAGEPPRLLVDFTSNAVIPEPGTMGLLAAGVSAMLLVARRRR